MKTLQKHCDISGFIQSLCKEMNGKRSVVTDAGQAFFITPRNLALKDGDRMILSYSQADMGFAVPASIGVSLASGKQVIAITGDGSFQLNIQELQVIKHHNLDIKIFVLNNNGYDTSRQTQEKFFNRYLGVDKESGISFPAIDRVANTYGIKYYRYQPDILNKILALSYPVICEVA